jgi:hypothetical protein
MLVMEINIHMKSIMCPHLKGSREGAVCSFNKKLIKDMEDINIRLCMNRHYEVCPGIHDVPAKGRIRKRRGNHDTALC